MKNAPGQYSYRAFGRSHVAESTECSLNYSTLKLSGCLVAGPRWLMWLQAVFQAGVGAQLPKSSTVLDIILQS